MKTNKACINFQEIQKKKQKIQQKIIQSDFSIFTVGFKYWRDKKTRREICWRAILAKIKSDCNYWWKIGFVVGNSDRG